MNNVRFPEYLFVHEFLLVQPLGPTHSASRHGGHDSAGCDEFLGGRMGQHPSMFGRRTTQEKRSTTSTF